MLTIINPTTRKPGKTKEKKMATRKRRKGMPAGLKRYWAKVRGAKRDHNPGPVVHRRRRRVHRNPVVTSHRRRRVHRNPSQMFTSKGIFAELMTAEGLMMIAAVAATPTITSLAVNAFAPSLTGYQRAGAKAAVGLGLGFATYKFVNKKAGLVAAVAALGIAAAECYNFYSKGGTVAGYATPSFNGGNLHGYATGMYDDMGDDLGYVPEPGTYNV